MKEGQTHKCGQEGHYTAQCNKAQPTAPCSTPVDSNMKPKGRLDLKDIKSCNCHHRGHLAKKCPSAFYCERELIFQQGGGDRAVVVGGCPGESGDVEVRDVAGVVEVSVGDMGDGGEVCGSGAIDQVWGGVGG